MELKFMKFTVAIYEAHYEATFDCALLGECVLRKEVTREGQKVDVASDTLEDAQYLEYKNKEGKAYKFFTRAKTIEKESEGCILRYQTTVAWPMTAEQEAFREYVKQDLEADWAEIMAILGAHPIKESLSIEALLKHMDQIHYTELEYTRELKEYYIKNLAYLADEMACRQKALPTWKRLPMTLEKVYLSMIGLMMSYLLWGFAQSMFSSHQGPIGMLQRRLARVGVSPDKAASVTSWIGGVFCCLLAILAIMAILLGLMGIYDAIKGNMMLTQWLRYNDIPVIGTAASMIWESEEEETAVFSSVSIQKLSHYFKDDYERVRTHYNNLQTIALDTPEQLSQEALRYLSMMNLLAALDGTKGIVNGVEKRLLIKEIKKCMKQWPARKKK